MVSDECAPRRWCSWGAARFGALIIVPLLVSALVGCGAGSQAGRSEHPTSTATASPASVPTATGTAAATGAGSPLPCPLLTPGPLATVLPGGPAIISANGWSAYTNTAYHFSIQYPANWIVDSPLTTTGPITFLNYDPRQLNGAGLPPPPPYTAIAIDPFPNPSQLTPFGVLSRQSECVPTRPTGLFADDPSIDASWSRGAGDCPKADTTERLSPDHLSADALRCRRWYDHCDPRRGLFARWRDVTGLRPHAGKPHLYLGVGHRSGTGGRSHLVNGERLASP